MNLNFVPATRRPFSMEVNSIDTIQEIKQQIQERHQIPAEKQTLIFNNRILQDDHTMSIDYPEIIKNSHIQLIISESTPPPPENQEPPPPSATTATTSWEFGSSTENSAPPEIPTAAATTKFYQESSWPPGMANPDTTLSNLGISLENTNQFPSLPQDMDLLNTAPPEIPTTATAQESSLPPRMANPDTTFSNLAIPLGNKFPPSLPPRMAMAPAPAMATLSNKITLLLNMPVIGVTRRAMEFEVNDSILRVKEKIVNQVDQLNPDGKLVLRSYGIELHDRYTLLECGLIPHSEIDVSVKRSAPPPSFLTASTDINPNIPKVPKFPSSSSNPLKMDNNNGKNKNVMEPNIPKNPKKLEIMVLPFNGKNKVAVEVNANDNVEELRKELDKVNEREPLNLSKEGFFFIHKQSVMDEDQSFEVQNVQEGDTIEIVNGSIAKGSPHQKLGPDDDPFDDFDIHLPEDQVGLPNLVDDIEDLLFHGPDFALAGPPGPLHVEGADDDTFEDLDIYMADDQIIKVDLELEDEKELFQGLDVARAGPPPGPPVIDLVDEDALFQGLDVALAGPSGPPVIDLEDEDVDIMSVDNGPPHFGPEVAGPPHVDVEALPPALNEERLGLFVALKKSRCDAVRLLGEKKVSTSDLVRNNCRLQLTGEISGVLDDFLTEQEIHQLNAGNIIETRMFFIKPGVDLEQQDGDFQMKLTKYPRMLVLNGSEWNNLVLSCNVLQKGMMIRLWAYRVGEQLGFALTV